MNDASIRSYRTISPNIGALAPLRPEPATGVLVRPPPWWSLALSISLASAAAGCNASTSASGRALVDSRVELGASISGSAAADSSAGAVHYDREHKNLEIAGEIHFKFDKAVLQDTETARTFETLRNLAAFLKAHPAVAVLVEGHSDSRGGDDYNRDLSNRRAAAILEWLVTKGGIDRKRLSSKGFGKDVPYAKGEPAECLGRKDGPDWCEAKYWEPNRRTRFHVESGEETIASTEPSAPAEDAVGDESTVPIGPKYVVGLATGVLFPSGSASTGAPLGDAVKFVVPVEGQIGIWVSRKFALGVDGRYGFAMTDADNMCGGQRCSASGNQLRFGLWGEYHPNPTAGAWLGLGLGWEQLKVSVSAPGGDVTTTQQGVEFANARVGYDWTVASWLRAGPFLTASVGQYAGGSDLHEWFGGGLRGAHDF